MWNGCVIDRTQNYDVSADAPDTANKPTLYPKTHCAVPTLLAIRPLTNNLVQLAADVDLLTPSGNTNLTIGVQWGMEALTPTVPLTGRQSKAKQVMIVLTDGENTQNRWKGRWERPSIDGRTKLACDNAKALGAEVYTIRLMGGNETLLRNCASSVNHYYAVTAASALSKVFADIAQQVKTIRLVG